MLRLALLGSQFRGQLATRSLDTVEVIWVGSLAERFSAEVPPLHPDVVVIDLDALGAVDDVALRSLIDRCQAELSILTYSFARRAVIRSLQGPRVRVLQSPITIDLLLAHLAPLIIRNDLTHARKDPAPMSSTPAGPRFTREQLGKLMEVSSTVQCECPNHLAQVVERLQAFEAYSKDCESRNEADRAIHAALYLASATARLEMEKALEKLVVHEKLTV